MKKLQSIEGFILSDIVQFPTVDIFVVPVEYVVVWYKAGILGVNAQVSRNKFLEQLAPQLPH